MLYSSNNQVDLGICAQIIQIWNNITVSKQHQNFHFWAKLPSRRHSVPVKRRMYCLSSCKTYNINHPWKPPNLKTTHDLNFFLSFFFIFLFFFFAITKNKTDLSLSVLNKALVVLENLLALCGWLHEEHQVWEQIRIDFSVNTTYLLF